MASEAIGQIKCPCCASQKARVSVSKAGRCVVTCNACHFQGFARSDYSDTLIRQGMTPIEKARAAEAAAPRPPEPAPGQEIAPVPAPKIEAAPARVAAPEPKQEPAAPAVKPRSAWDVF